MAQTRPGLPARGTGLDLDERLPRSLRAGGRDKDIFAMVKQNMSSTVLCQNPLLVWPHNLLPDTEEFLNSVNTAATVKPSLDPERAEELRRLAKSIQADFPHMHRAVKFYEQLLDENRHLEPYKEINFIYDVPKASFRWRDINLGAAPLPPKPHHLKVVFHR